jgi:type I restriction enzyme S subunit
MYGATIGKTGILTLEGTTNQAVCGCTPLSVITADYLHLQLKALRNVFLNQGEGGAQRRNIR